MSIAGGCLETDNPRMIAAAKAACMHLARNHIAQSGPDQAVFAETSNVSSDPEANSFEFKWAADDLIGAKGNPGGVWCRGHAGRRVITDLHAQGAQIIRSPQSY